ncbi:DUF5362 domain-containing protein [Balneolaceae bacterium YR4-1]|uniref:DUF5362 domain-containing protein n=1 Tax=Halalkalibaculum roseum TaxID=2709311 RepID=A0A6M1STY1_9BACT|nr:DUF5362 family protein [Halalkalibaculum roseum]NGP76390.1 DUF5362 domain-containing protein [Halalkalibaculum roseum]
MDVNASEDQITLQNISVLQGELLSDTVSNMASDMKFYAIFYLIVGIFYCFTIFGALYGIPLIIYCIKLKDSADQYREFVRDKDFTLLLEAMENQRKFFFFNKIVIIIGILFTLLYVLLIFWFGSALFFDMPSRSFA